MMQTIQLLTSISLLILVHELGHFMFAKLFKTRVDKFYLFFNPGFSLFKYKYGETTYGLGWLPFGGYCKIAGMVDESLDKNQLKKEPKPWEYRSKTLGQRFLIISGGVIFNFILAFIIYSGILYTWGERYLPIQNAHYGIYCDSLALDAGFMHGDRILKVDNTTPERLSDVLTGILLDDASTVTVLRNGHEVSVDIPPQLKRMLLAEENMFFITDFIPFFIDSVMAQTPAQKAGLRRGDRVIAIDSVPTPSFIDFVKEAQMRKGESAKLTIIRNSFEEHIPITFSADGTIGAYRKGLDKIYEFKHKEYSLLQSIPAGVKMGVSNLGFYMKQMKLIFTKEGSQQIGSFVSMGKLYDTSWNWQWFWTLTALFSVIIAFMNLLPIPGLDGGHLMFLVYELIAGKKPSDSFLEKAQMIGMSIVLALFLYAIVLDFGRLF